MRLVFMGTPDFAVPGLRALVAAGHDLRLVLTRPDRPKGRGLQLVGSPVKAAALALGLPVFQPERPNRPEAVAEVRRADPEALIVVAYGAILKTELLELAPLGAINLHASLLPKYRGMSPIHRALWDGQAETGVTTMQMDAGIDTGEILLMQRTPIGPDETCGELHDRLAALGADLLVRTLEERAAGRLNPRPQEGSASYAGRIEKEHGVIDWSLSAAEVHDHARAVTPWPGATARLAGESITVKRTRVVSGADQPAGSPGTIVSLGGNALLVACGSGQVELLELRPSGRPTMTGAEFARGRRLAPGAAFDPAVSA